MKKCVLIMLLLLLPLVSAVEFNDPQPFDNLSIEGNAESVSVGVDVLLLANAIAVEESLLLPKFFGQPNITVMLDGYNNDLGWYGNINFFVPEHTGKFFGKTFTVPNKTFSGFVGYYDGVCFGTNIIEQSPGETKIIINESTIALALCNETGKFNYTALSDLHYAEQKAYMRIDGIEYSFDELSFDGTRLSKDFVVLDGDNIEVIVSIPFIDGTAEYNWNFLVHTNLSEQEPIIQKEIIIIEEDDDDSGHRRSSGGFVSFVLDDPLNDSPVIEEDVPEVKIKSNSNIIPQSTISPLESEGNISSEDSSDSGFSFIQMMWAVCILLIIIIICFGLWFYNKNGGEQNE